MESQIFEGKTTAESVRNAKMRTVKRCIVLLRGWRFLGCSGFSILDKEEFARLSLLESRRGTIYAKREKGHDARKGAKLQTQTPQ